MKRPECEQKREEKKSDIVEQVGKTSGSLIRKLKVISKEKIQD